MKRIYWRPRAVSRQMLVLICLASLAGMLMVEEWRLVVQQPHYEQKLAAARLARDAMALVKARRMEHEIPIDPEIDPAQSGLIGDLMTPITSRAGALTAKRTSVNPNFAAVIVEMLKQAGVGKGDRVAVSLSGSFPALNICTLTALQEVEAQPVIISGVSASQWGANLPQFTWLDMEKALVDAGMIKHHSLAATLGGIEDRGVGMSKSGIKLLKDAVARNNLPLIEPTSFEDGVKRRMELYRQHAKGQPFKAYINVGGSTTSIGAKVGRKELAPGINHRIPIGMKPDDSVMTSIMTEDGAVGINLLKIEELAQRHGLAVLPESIPEVGRGSIYKREQYNLWLAAGVLGLILCSMWLFVRSDVGFRLFQSTRSKGAPDHPEPMV